MKKENSKMDYKEINSSVLTRADYLYEHYCTDTTLTPASFIESIKTAYYKFDAAVYNIGYAKLLQKSFSELFTTLPQGYRIVDIGAGTGETFRAVKDTGYVYDHYYFVEPFKSMSDQFIYTDADKVTIINDYFEGTKESIPDSDIPTVYILCGVLRTMDKLQLFLDNIKNRMKKGDIFFLPIEPNNVFFHKYYGLLKPLLFGKRVWNKIKRVIAKFFRSHEKSESKTHSVHPLVQALKHLQDNGTVNSRFTTEILYAVVYYNNYLLWRNIPIPEKYNDGFFTIEQVAADTECEIASFDTWSYFYSLQFPLGEKLMHALFPQSGSTFSVVLRKS